MRYAEQPNGRAWVARCHWKGAAKPFWYGTVYVRLDAPRHEIEAAVCAAVREIIPPHFELPEILQLAPGLLVFLPEEAR